MYCPQSLPNLSAAQIWLVATSLLDGTTETLVLLGIIVLESNLEFNSLYKFPLLVFSTLENISHAVVQSLFRYFTESRKQEKRSRTPNKTPHTR